MNREDNFLETTNEKDILISFCLPVYNVKQFLEDCLKSIEGQNLEQNNISYEIFCIDDGSSDGSYEFLLEKAKTIPQLRVLKNEENKGVSYTRNRLTREALGEYIWYVDPDDMLYPCVAEKLFDLAEKEKADVLLGNYLKVKETVPYEEKDEINISEIEYCVPEIGDWSWLPDKKGESRMFSLWRGLFKRDFLIKNELFLNEKVVLMEDALLYYEMKRKAPKIVKIEIVCYQVRQRAGSAMRSKGNDLKRIKKGYESSLELVRVYKEYAYSFGEVEIEAENRMKELFKSNIFALTKIKDFKYVRTKLKEMKERKEYPEMLKKITSSSFKERALFFLFRYTICIYGFNVIYRLKTGIK